MCLSFPTFHLIPLLNKSLPHKMLLDVSDELEPSLASRKSACLKYLPLRILVTMLLGFFMILQLCFASTAWLNKLSSLKPRPPFSLLRQNLFQLIQWVLFLSPTDPHQNLAQSLFISSQNDFGSLKQHMVYFGMACTTALIKISFPPDEKGLSFKPWRIFHTLSFTFQKTLFFFLPVWEGMPK